MRFILIFSQHNLAECSSVDSMALLLIYAFKIFTNVPFMQPITVALLGVRASAEPSCCMHTLTFRA